MSLDNYNKNMFQGTDKNMLEHENKLASLLDDIKINIEQNKISIIKGRLSEMGIDFDFYKEKNRRFKNLLIEFHDVVDGNEERYYYNDGSELGILVVTFYNEFINNFDIHEPISYNLNYK